MQFLLFLCLVVSPVLSQSTQGSCVLGDEPIQLTSWRGEIRSPGWKTNQYPGNQKCQWDIKVSRGSRVRLTFTRFDLETGYYRNKGEGLLCDDVVKIADDQNYLFTGCQNEGENRTFESTGNEMSIYFNTDENIERAGFLATYEGICHTDVTEGGLLESPGFPDPPPDGVTCEWNVTSQSGMITYIRPDENDTLHVLPNCGSSPLNWQTTSSLVGVADKNQELCHGDSKVVTRSDVLLIYTPNNASSWTGSIYVDYIQTSGCDRYCDNGFSCLKSRNVNDPGDYRCLCQNPYSGHNCEIYTDPCVLRNCSGVGTCITADDKANSTCDCQPGFTGEDCEVEVDPCKNLTCLNGGQCEKQNATSARCRCLPGYLPPSCHPPPSPCQSSPCHHGGTCMLERSGGYLCACVAGYTGTLCTIPYGDAHCLEEVDDTVGSNIAWKDTLAGNHAEQPCPTGITGVAKRNCMRDERSPTGGLWRRPDLSDCVSPPVLQLLNDSKALTRAGVAGDVLYNVTRRLDNVTSVTKTKNSPALYPGDLLSAVDVLRDISVGVVNAQSADEDPPGLTQHFTSSIDNIVDPSTIDVWKNARVNLVENKVTSLLTSAQRFAENLVRRQNGRRVMSRAISPGSPYTLLYAAADGVDLVVTEWGVPNTSWSPSFTATKTSLTSDPMTSDPPQPLLYSSIRLPPDLLDIARGDGSDRNVKLYSGRFTSIAPLLSLKEHRYIRENEEKATKIVNSDVISAEVLDLPKSAFSKLHHPVEITLRLTDPEKRKDLDKLCVFMNMSTNDPEQRWLDDGCYVQDLNSTHVTCSCYHLTNFAVLLDVYDTAADIDEANSAALSYLSYIGGSLSILACVVVVAVFEYFRLHSDRVRIHEQLALSIIAVQVLFLIGVGRTAADRSTPEWACKTVAILMHFALTALFCWMLVEGIHIYVLLVKVFKRGSHLKKYIAIGWGVPVIVVGISVGVFFDKYGDGDLCLFNHELLLVCFVPTVSLVIIINVVILILVLRVMLRSLNSTTKANTEHKSNIRTGLKASAVLLPLLGLTWILGFLSVDTDDTHVLVYIFTYLFVICNSFQGVMFFVLHCLLNVDVHQAYERRYRQRKRAMSSQETTTRKGSVVSTYLADSTPTGKSSTKTTFSDISAVMQRKSSVGHDRFLLFDRHHNHHPHMDPTHPYPADADYHPHHRQQLQQHFPRHRHPSFEFDHHHNPYDPSVSVFDDGNSRGDLSFDASGSVFDDMQTSDTEKIWRRYDSVGLEQHIPSAATPASPTGNVARRYPPGLFAHPTAISSGNNHNQTAAGSAMDAFVLSMHDVLDRPRRTSVHFSQD